MLTNCGQLKLLTALFTNPPVPWFAVFAWYNSCERKNGHILSIGEWPQEAAAAGGFWKTAGN